MPICPEHAASTSPVRGLLVAGQPPPFSVRIVWDDQSSVSSHQEDPKYKPVYAVKQFNNRVLQSSDIHTHSTDHNTVLSAILNGYPHLQ